jgi:tRNAThr (cytosine32-N3)-methyltransferase
MRESPNFSAERCNPFVWDISKPIEDGRIEPGTLDLVLLCPFCPPTGPAQTAVKNLCSLLKPGGLLFVKDYHLHDLTQLRFKKDRLIDGNLYSRGDGTLVYFFSAEEMDTLLSGAGLEMVQNSVDKRLIVNRAKKQQMFRRWLQCKYVKK